MTKSINNFSFLVTLHQFLLKFLFMKKAFILTYLSLIFVIGLCQSNESEVIATSGEYFENSGISLSWTLGECITETFSNENIILTQGFQQKITSQTDSQEYIFSIGYQFVSSHIIPENRDMLDVLENILNPNLDFVRNSSGSMLRKIGPVWVNGIGDWTTTEGYLFKMSGPEFLTISGQTINPQTPINLLTGYQIISFLPDEQQNTSVAFESVLESLDFVRNTNGNMFRKIGPIWVNGIGDMQPGEGYLVKMNAGDILIYPEEEKILFAAQKLKPEHFQVSDGNPYDPVWTIYFERGNLETGDEIAVFDNKRLTGSAVVISDNILENEIPVFSNLFKIGNDPTIKVWDKSKNKESIISNYKFIKTYENAFTGRTFPSEDGKYSFLKFSVNGISWENSSDPSFIIYPNPTKGIINIEKLSGTQKLSGIEITDVFGKTIHKSSILNFQTCPYGSSIEIDLSWLEKGVYFIGLKGTKFIQVEKIIIQ